MVICKPSYWVPNKMQIETRGAEKFSVLLFANKVLCAACRDQECHAEDASALSDSSPTSPASSFLQASKLFLESTKRNLQQKNKFLWQARRNSKSKINLEAEIFNSKTQAHAFNKRIPFQLGVGWSTNSLTIGTESVDVREVTRLGMVGNWRKHVLCHIGSHWSALANSILRKCSPSEADIAVFKETLKFMDFVRSPHFQVFQIIIWPGKLNGALRIQSSLFSFQDGGMLGPPQNLSLVCKGGSPWEESSKDEQKGTSAAELWNPELWNPWT